MNVSVRGICVRDGKLFCVRNTGYITGKPNEFWCTPGGSVDAGEDLVSTLKREIKEELGIDAQVGNLLYIQEYFHKPLQDIYLEFFYHILNDADFDNIDLSKTSHGQAEIADFGFINPAKEVTLPKFLATESLSNLAAQPIKTFTYL